MALTWSDLTCTPDADAIESLVNAWSWRLNEPFTPILFSVLGDAFLKSDSGEVFWLNTGTADLNPVAKSTDEFYRLLGTEAADEWFMPGLVEQLHAAGKIPNKGECYTYVTLPIFAEGDYSVDNLNPVPAEEHFEMTGDVLQQIRSLPDGAKIDLKVEK